jgi:hypothetical protein
MKMGSAKLVILSKNLILNENIYSNFELWLII